MRMLQLPETEPLSPEAAESLVIASREFIAVSGRLARVHLVAVEAARLLSSPEKYESALAGYHDQVARNLQCLGTTYGVLGRAAGTLMAAHAITHDTAPMTSVGFDLTSATYTATVSIEEVGKATWPLLFGEQVFVQHS